MIEQVPEINETIPNHCPTVLFWDGMGWDGMGWDGMGWDGMGWDGNICSLVSGSIFFLFK